MIFVLMGIACVVIIVCICLICVFSDVDCDDWEFPIKIVSIVILVLATLGLIVSIVMAFKIGDKYNEYKVAENKLKILESDNIRVTNELDAIVDIWIESHERMDLIDYPSTAIAESIDELRENEFVRSKLNALSNNNDEIATLKIQSIKYHDYAWWYNFGRK